MDTDMWDFRFLHEDPNAGSANWHPGEINYQEKLPLDRQKILPCVAPPVQHILVKNSFLLRKCGYHLSISSLKLDHPFSLF